MGKHVARQQTDAFNRADQLVDKNQSKHCTPVPKPSGSQPLGSAPSGVARLSSEARAVSGDASRRTSHASRPTSRAAYRHRRHLAPGSHLVPSHHLAPRHHRTHSSRQAMAKLLGSLAAVAMVVTGLLVFSAQRPAEATDWPNAGDPGTIQGRVYVDSAGLVQDYNPVLGDKAISGVKMNALVVKSDGTVIANNTVNGVPEPFTVTTDENGYYSFNFKPAMVAAYGGEEKASGDQIKLAIGDYVRVWPDDSNYEDGGALAGLTPKRLNGGTRFTEISTTNLSWLGSTNYVHGSISNMNMSYRAETQRATSTSDFGTTSAGKHLAKDQWQPTVTHDIDKGVSSSQNPYLCGAVYADTTFPYDSWNGRGNRDTSSSPDQVVAGVRVAVTTYSMNWLGQVNGILETRYDYTDQDGRWCINWPSMSSLKNRTAYSEKVMVTIDLPSSAEEAQQDLAALKSQTSSSAYDDLTPLLEGETNGMPVGYVSTGANGWYGTIRPVGDLLGLSGVGYANTDVACVTRGNYCLSDLLWGSTGSLFFKADGADLGIIPGPIEASYYLQGSNYQTPQYTVPTGVDTTVDVKLSHSLTSLDPNHIVVMVAQGQDPTVESNWVAVSDAMVLGATTSTLKVRADVPAGNYSLYTYSVSDSGVDFSQLHDVDSLRVTNTHSYYYLTEAEQSAAVSAIETQEQPTEGVTQVIPGTTLYNAYSDLGTGTSKVYLVPSGVAATDSSAVLKDEALTGFKNADEVWVPYAGKDSFTIPQNTEPGSYDLVVVDQGGNEVDRQALTVEGPVLSIATKTIATGGSSTVELKQLNPDTTYTLTFTPAGGGTPITQSVQAAADGTATATITVPDGQENSGYLGLGTVTLTKQDSSSVLASGSLLVSNRKQYGPQIILPGVTGSSANDGLVGVLSGWPCSSDEECQTKWHLNYQDPVYQARQSGASFTIYGSKDTGSGVENIPGGVNNENYEWTMTYTCHDANGSQSSSCAENAISWDAANPSVLKMNSAGPNYYVVTLTLTDKTTGLSDTRSFAIHPYIGLGNQNTFGAKYLGFSAVLTQGQAAPEGQYCITRTDGTAITGAKKAESAQVTDQWPTGLDLTDNGCLTGTPTAVTPDQDFVDLWASVGSDTPGSSTPVSTLRVAVQEPPDTEAPQFSATFDGKTVNSGDTISIQQGDGLPLVINATDDKQLTILRVSSETLPQGVSAPSADPAVSGTGEEAVTSSKLDFSSSTVSLEAAPGSYGITVLAMDAGDNLSEYSLNLQVTKKLTPPVFAEAQPPSGEAGTAFGTDGNGWSIPVTDSGVSGEAGKVSAVTLVSGTLPPGINLAGQKDGTYKLVGTPTTAGTYTFTLRAEDEDGATTEQTYTVTIAAPPTPTWDSATSSASSEVTIELGQAAPEDGWYKFGVDPVDGRTASFSVTPADDSDTEAAMLPAGLSLTTSEDGASATLSGTATALDPDGTDYVFSASYGGENVEKTLTIKVVDTTAPQVNQIGDQTLRVGEVLNQTLTALDNNSAGAFTWSDASCKSGDKSFSLQVDSESGKLTSVQASADDLGTYSCQVTVADQSGNTSSAQFTLTVRPDAPLLSISPATQSVTTNGSENGTAISPIGVDNEEGSTLDVSDCQSKLPSTVTWDADSHSFTGTVNNLLSAGYQCQITATDDSDPDKVTTETLTLNVDGPVTGPVDQDGNLAVSGRQGKELVQTVPIVVRGGSVSVSEETKATLDEYGLTFQDGKLSGIPTKATAGTVTIQLTGTNSEGQNFSIPLSLTIESAATVSGIPESATVGQKFTPVVENGEAGETYQVSLCDPQNQCVTGKAGEEITVPDGAGPYTVKVTDSAGTVISANTATITITPVALVAQDGSDLPDQLDAGSTLGGKVENATAGETYTLKLCASEDEQCANPLAEVSGIGTQASSFEVKLPDAGANAEADTPLDAGYSLKLVRDSDGKVVLEQDVTAVAPQVEPAETEETEGNTDSQGEDTGSDTGSGSESGDGSEGQGGSEGEGTTETKQPDPGVTEPTVEPTEQPTEQPTDQPTNEPEEQPSQPATAPAKPGVTAVKHADGSATVTITVPEAAAGAPSVCLKAAGSNQCQPYTQLEESAARTFTFTIPASALGTDLTVEVSVQDANGLTSEVATTSVAATVTAPVTNPVANKTQVSGSVDSSVADGSTVTVRDEQGQQIGSGEVVTDSHGSKSFVVIYDEGKAPADGAKLTVTVTDKATGVTSVEVSVTVDAIDPVLQVDASVGSQVTGMVEVGASVSVSYIDVDGVTHSVPAKVNADGSFSLELDPVAADGSVLTVTATDPAGNSTSNAQTVQGNKPETPTIKFAKDNPSVVSGKSSPAGSRVEVCVNAAAGGEAVCATGTVGQDGTYRVELPGGTQLQQGDTIKVTVTDVNNGASAQSSAQVDFQAPDAPQQVKISADGKQISGQGEPGCVARVTLPDGSTVNTTVGSDGKFTVELNDDQAIKHGQSVTVDLTDQQGNTSEAVLVTADFENSLSQVEISTAVVETTQPESSSASATSQADNAAPVTATEVATDSAVNTPADQVTDQASRPSYVLSKTGTAGGSLLILALLLVGAGGALVALRRWRSA